MGRIRDEAIFGGIKGRTGEKTSPEVSEKVEKVEKPSKKKSSRDGMHFIGFYASDEHKEGLRTLAFETRKQNQQLMREALDLLFKKYGVKMDSSKEPS